MGFRGPSYDAERRQPLGQLHVWSLQLFQPGRLSHTVPFYLVISPHCIAGILISKVFSTQRRKATNKKTQKQKTVFLGLMDAQLRVLLNYPRTSQYYSIDGFYGGLHLVPHYAEKCQCRGQPMYVFPAFRVFERQRLLSICSYLLFFASKICILFCLSAVALVLVITIINYFEN